MSVLRVKSYHSEQAITNGLAYSADERKMNIANREIAGEIYNGGLDNIDLNVQHAFTYSVNPDKTTIGVDGDSDILVSGQHCKPDLASLVFKMSMDLYHQKGHTEKLDLAKSKRLFRAALDQEGNPLLDENGEMIYDAKAPVYHDADGKCVYQSFLKQKERRTAYMWVLSFPPKEVLGYEIDPRLVHQIGKEFCQEFLGDYACTISTHVNTKHIHNHIMQCAYSLDGSHKYKDNKDMLARARICSDNLSLKYGLPIILEPSRDIEKSIKWFEWMHRYKGDSWKDQMKRDIKDIVSVSRNFDDFKRIMQASGYHIRETDKHFTYYMPDDEFRCRDVLLGQEYTKGEIIHFFENREQSKVPELHVIEDPLKKQGKIRKNRIYVSRYTLNGRKRSDLEILLIAAIKMIKLFADKFSAQNVQETDNPVFKSAKWKLTQMEESLNYIEKLGVKNLEELDVLITKTGMELSQIKKAVKDHEQAFPEEQKVLDKISEALTLVSALSDAGITADNLFLHSYSAEEVRKNKAALSPMTADQKRRLFVELEKNPVYRISCKFDDISYSEAQNIISFLRGESSLKPELVASLAENEQNRLRAKYDKVFENRISALKNKYQDLPLSTTQEKKIADILAGKDPDTNLEKLNQFANKEIDTAALSYYDAIRIIAYFNGKNDYNDTLLDQISQDKLQHILDANNAKISRPVEFVTLKEARQIEKYFANGKKGRVPDLLNNYEAPAQSMVKEVEQLLELFGESVNVPLEYLSKSEIGKLDSYLVLKDHIPECLESLLIQDTEKDVLFESELLNYDLDKQQILYHGRELLNELASFGVTLDNVLEIQNEIQQSINDYHNKEDVLKQLGSDYRNLSRLKYNLKLAENPQFTHGPLYNDQEVENQIKVETVENLDDLDNNLKKDVLQEERDMVKKTESDKSIPYSTMDHYFAKLAGLDI